MIDTPLDEGENPFSTSGVFFHMAVAFLRQMWKT